MLSRRYLFNPVIGDIFKIIHFLRALESVVWYRCSRWFANIKVLWCSGLRRCFTKQKVPGSSPDTGNNFYNGSFFASLKMVVLYRCSKTKITTRYCGRVVQGAVLPSKRSQVQIPKLSILFFFRWIIFSEFYYFIF